MKIGTNTASADLLLVSGVNAEAVRIKSDGKVGIGTNAPSSKLEVVNTDITAGEKIFTSFTEGNSNKQILLTYDANGATVTGCRIRTGGTVPLFLGATGVINALTILPTSGNIGINVIDPHSKLEVNGAISSATLVVTTANDGAGINVAGVNAIFVDSSAGNISIDDFTGGVAGQQLLMVVKDNTNQVTFTDTSGANQEMILHDEANLVIAANNRGGLTLICDGSDWYDVSHSQHV